MLRRFFAIRFAAFLVAVQPVHSIAQQRTMNSGAPGTLRTWPDSGKWDVLLGRNADGKVFYGLLTGFRDQANSEFYFWGMRHLDGLWSVMILDKNPSALLGDKVSVLVDGTQIGSFSISKRTSQSGVNGVRADIPDATSKRVIRLMALGDNLKFVTAGSTYSVQLAGMSNALNYMSSCDEEAENLKDLP